MKIVRAPNADAFPRLQHAAAASTRRDLASLLAKAATEQRKAESLAARGIRSGAVSPTSDQSTSPPPVRVFSRRAVFNERDTRRWKLRGPLNVITGIFTCWTRARDASVSGGGEGRRSRLQLTTAALIEQTRIQQVALLEMEDTRDMWEWQMEQQQAIASEEHEALERAAGESMATGEGIVMMTGRTSVVGSAGKTAGEDDDDDSESTEWNFVAHQPDLPSSFVNMYETALLRCRWEVNVFCRIYMQQMVSGGFSLMKTLTDLEPSTVFLRSVHASYALEARIYVALFRCFENDSFDDTGLTRIFDSSLRMAARMQEYVRLKALDPSEALRMHSPSYEPAFHSFCATKSEEVLATLPGALAYRSAAQRDRFMDAFLRAAKWAWLLHRLATASSPPAQILRVPRGSHVDPLYVESVAVPPIGSCPRCPVTSVPKVEFMIVPGFVAPRKIFRCKVYQHFMCKQ